MSSGKPDPGAPWALALHGTPALLRQGQAQRTSSRRALAMAVLLALESPLSRERLADLLWPGTERPIARRNLRRDLFRLRELGLPITDHGHDAVAAIGLAIHWPDPALGAPAWLQGLDELASAELDDWAQGQRERIHQRWLDTLSQRAQQLEQTGDEAAALRLWQALLAEGVAGPEHAPARQAALRLHQQLGQHAQALALSRAAEAAPGVAATPASATSSAPGARTGAAPLPTRLPFTGRSAPLQQIGQALQAQRLVFIDGTAGAGKTRLALEAVASLGGTLHVRCRPEDANEAFASALRLLAQLREAAPDAEAALPRWVKQELAPLLPEWADAGTAAAAGAPAAQSLLRMTRAFETAWRALALDNFAAVVIDDWQWADASSLALWNVETAPDPAWPVARLIVHRAGELSAAALERRRALLDAGQAVVVHVPNLAPDELLALVRALAHSSGGERFAARLHAATAGNPLFLQQTLRHLFDTGLLDADAQGQWHTPYDAVTEDYAELAVPASVREAVQARARALGPAVRRLLEAACLAGDGLTPRLLAAPAGLDELAAAQALEHAAAADLLQEGRDGRYRFAHDLIAQSLADGLSGARRMALHAQLAEQLIAQQAAPGRIAEHLALAQRGADAARWQQRAADAARRRRAWSEAVRHGQLALQGEADPARRSALQQDLAAALRALGDAQACGAALDRAVAEAAPLGGAATLQALVARAAHWIDQHRGDEALAALQAVAADPAMTPELAVRVATEQARVHSLQGRHDQTANTLQQLLKALPASLLSEQLRVLPALSRAQFFLGDLSAAAGTAQRTLDLARELADDYQAAAALGHLGVVQRERGHLAESRALLQQTRELAARAGNLHVQRVALYNLMVAATDEGDVQQAEALIDEAEGLSPFWENPLFRHSYLEARYYLHYLPGHVAQARAAAEQALAGARALNHPHGHLGTLRLVFDLYLHLGELDTAAALVEEGLALLERLGGDAVRRPELLTQRLQLQQRQGQAEAVLATWDQLQPDWPRMREDTKGRAVAAALQAALDLGDLARAQLLGEQARALATVSIETRLLRQAALLRLAARQASAAGDRATPALLAATRAEAAQALAEPNAPHFAAARLRQALADLPH
jgi:DNA-binding SARP family transcriptional activator